MDDKWLLKFQRLWFTIGSVRPLFLFLFLRSGECGNQ